MAEPGEFTRRAFENGRLDLTAVEGLADLIAAETEAQRKQGYRQLKGLLGDRAEDWRKRLIAALALVEARIDFSDEGDVPKDLVRPALEVARALRDKIAEVLAGTKRGERLRDGWVVVIAGPPNVGKSTLFNWLAQREAAIVSETPGTTRDVLEVHLDLGGYPVTVLDTAGIRVSNDPIEQEGIGRARRRAADADLVLWVDEAGKEVSNYKSQDLEVKSGTGTEVWHVLSKVDLSDSNEPGIILNEQKYQFESTFSVSAQTGKGMNHLSAAIMGYARRYFEEAGTALITRERHREALAGALEALDRALGGDIAAREEIIAEELRLAARWLGRLTGRVDVEDILDTIFRDFCIGK